MFYIRITLYGLFALFACVLLLLPLKAMGEVSADLRIDATQGLSTCIVTWGAGKCAQLWRSNYAWRTEPSQNGREAFWPAYGGAAIGQPFWQGLLVMSLRLRKNARRTRHSASRWANRIMRLLEAEAAHSRMGKHSYNAGVAGCTGAMHQSTQQKLEKLRRTRHYIRYCLDRLCPIFARHGAEAAGNRLRQDRQQQGVLQEQLPVDTTQGELPQYTPQSNSGLARREFVNNGIGRTFQPKPANVLFSCCVAWLVFGASSDAAGEVPPAANRWKYEITRQTRLEWGLNAPVATFAAQVQQESNFRPDARSPVGALGIAQFMPATAAWIAGAYDALGPSDPMNPTWALRAMARYDLHLFERIRVAENECERMAFALSAYNGGEKFRDRGIQLCAAIADCNPLRWFGNVELVDDGRSPAAWGENRGYPLNILLVREPQYVAAAWGRGACQ